MIHDKSILFDARLRDKFLAEGKITAKEVEDYLKELPDDEGTFEEGQVKLDE